MFQIPFAAVSCLLGIKRKRKLFKKCFKTLLQFFLPQVGVAQEKGIIEV